jgi:alkylglycerol monooxygenase
MERYGEILLIAMPAFLLLVFFEKWYGWYRGKDTYHNMDMVSSLSSGGQQCSEGCTWSECFDPDI